MKDAIINARVESELKIDVETILKHLGLNATQAITMFYQQIKFHKGIPFEIKIPNEETLDAMNEVELKQNEKITLKALEKEVKDHQAR
jgi:DNA-damage-inducible protein J